jgi:hypothetical protein
MTEREQFEAWAKDSGLWTDKWNTAQDEYLSHGTTWAWNAWQARATPALPQVPEGMAIVPVELLQLISEAAHTGLRHARAKNDSRSLVWTNAIADCKAMLAAAKEKGE